MHYLQILSVGGVHVLLTALSLGACYPWSLQTFWKTQRVSAFSSTKEWQSWLVIWVAGWLLVLAWGGLLLTDYLLEWHLPNSFWFIGMSLCGSGIFLKILHWQDHLWLLQQGSSADFPSFKTYTKILLPPLLICLLSLGLGYPWFSWTRQKTLGKHPNLETWLSRYTTLLSIWIFGLLGALLMMLNQSYEQYQWTSESWQELQHVWWELELDLEHGHILETLQPLVGTSYESKAAFDAMLLEQLSLEEYGLEVEGGWNEDKMKLGELLEAYAYQHHRFSLIGWLGISMLGFATMGIILVLPWHWSQQEE